MIIYTRSFQTLCGWPAATDEKRFNEKSTLRNAQTSRRSIKTGRLFRIYRMGECKTGRSQNSRSGFCD